MKLLWAEQAWNDYLHFQESDEKIRNRINELIKETKRTPFQGIGKPALWRGAASRGLQAPVRAGPAVRGRHQQGLRSERCLQGQPPGVGPMLLGLPSPLHYAGLHAVHVKGG